MATVKTAVSLRESLFEDIVALAREMNVPRSRLIAMALEEYLRRRENRRLLAAIDAAETVLETPSERRVSRAWRSRHRKLVEDQR